jgi:hypothetical protein
MRKRILISIVGVMRKHILISIVLLALVFLFSIPSLFAGSSNQDFYYTVTDPDVTSITVFRYATSGQCVPATDSSVAGLPATGKVTMNNIGNGTHFFLIVLYDGVTQGQLCYDLELSKTFAEAPGCANAFSFNPIP